MFTKEYFQEILDGFYRQMRLLDERSAALSLKPDAVSTKMRALLMNKKEEILNTIKSLPDDEAEALTFLYSAMPLSDLLDYPVSLFQAYAKHGAWLSAHGPFAGKVPERLFANYVLHHRINNEDLVDNRGFFYEQLQKTLGLPAYTASCLAETPLLSCPTATCVAGASGAEEAAGKCMYDAAAETNYWCAAQVTYHASDNRTGNPLTVYNSGTGRCGEESTFAVSALRSIGIPARQVYVPLWSHCDDNHAWVEVWCDTADCAAHSENAGEWYFLGACEPEERLNCGWFNEPASRAMLVHSRWFGPGEPSDPIVSQNGMARVLNHLSRYAYTTELTVKVEDEEHHPVPGARVRFHVLNQGNYTLMAELTAGSGAITGAKAMNKRNPAACGLVHLTTGYGDLYVTASKDGAFGDCHIRLENANRKKAAGDSEASCTITLHEAPSCSGTWQNVDFHAPSPGLLHNEILTEEQKAISAARLLDASAAREARLDAAWQEDQVARVLAHFSAPDAKELNEILHKAKGNLPELLKFLEWDAGTLVPADWEAGRQDHWKLLLLKSLREKDYKDTSAEVLIDCSENVLPYAGTLPAAESDEIFFRFQANPRVENEMLRPCRKMLTEFFRENADALKKEPQKLPAFIRSLITPIPAGEYGRLVTSPAGCLNGGIASGLSIDVFCVTLYRRLGIPARLSPLDHSLQYYQDGKFITVSDEEKAPSCSALDTAKAAKTPINAFLRLTGDESLNLSNRERYSLSRYQNGEFVQLFLSGAPIDVEKNEQTLEVKPGIYRALTTNRMPDGNQLAKQLVFSLRAGEERTVALSLRTPSLAENLVNFPVKGLYFDTLMEDIFDKALFLWLQVGREPTEHILNELRDRRDAYTALASPLYVVLNKPEELTDPTLQRTMRTLPCLKPILGLSGDDLRTLAREVGQKADILPLTVVMKRGKKGNTCIYSNSGYNVGITDLLLQILRG